jgi:cytochrome c556
MSKWIRTGVAALLAAVVAVGVGVAADGEAGIAGIMKKLHKGKGAVHGAIKAQLGESTVDWAAVSKSSADYVQLAELLTKTKPETGEKSSWDKLTKSYADDAKALAAAAGKKDAAGANAAFGRLSKSCKACHDAHRD